MGDAVSAPSRTYQSLLNDIAALYTATRAGVVRMYWEIGKRIVEVEQAGADRSVYGGRLIVRLSADLTKRFGAGFSKSNLHRMRGLYLQRQIVPPAGQLSWSHQVELLSLPANVRQRLAARASGQELTRNELRELVYKERARLEPSDDEGAATPARPATPPTLLTPKRGALGLFRIKDIGDTRYVDLGFESYRELTETEVRRLHAGDLVRYSSGTLQRAPEAAPADLYAYEAQVLRVVDGDTLWMLIHLTGNDRRREKLRLRGVDCPEMGTAAGEAAKRYVQTQAREAKRILVTTTKPDKWDRYLSDVFLTTTHGDDVFLNNRLLETGHARRYDTVAPEDWEE